MTKIKKKDLLLKDEPISLTKLLQLFLNVGLLQHTI